MARLSASGQFGPVFTGGSGLFFLAGRIVPDFGDVAQHAGRCLLSGCQLGPVFVGRRGLLLLAGQVVPRGLHVPQQFCGGLLTLTTRRRCWRFGTRVGFARRLSAMSRLLCRLTAMARLSASGQFGPVFTGGSGLFFLAGRIVPDFGDVAQHAGRCLLCGCQLGPEFVDRGGLLLLAGQVVPSGLYEPQQFCGGLLTLTTAGI